MFASWILTDECNTIIWLHDLPRPGIYSFYNVRKSFLGPVFKFFIDIFSICFLTCSVILPSNDENIILSDLGIGLTSEESNIVVGVEYIPKEDIGSTSPWNTHADHIGAIRSLFCMDNSISIDR